MQRSSYSGSMPSTRTSSSLDFVHGGSPPPRLGPGRPADGSDSHSVGDNEDIFEAQWASKRPIVEARCACGVVHRLPTLTLEEERRLALEVDELRLELRNSREELLQLNEYALELERDARQKEESYYNMQREYETRQAELDRLESLHTDFHAVQRELSQCKTELKQSQRSSVETHTHLQSQVQSLQQELARAESRYSDLSQRCNPANDSKVSIPVTSTKASLPEYNNAALEILVGQLTQENKALQAAIRKKDVQIANLRVPTSLTAPPRASQLASSSGTALHEVVVQLQKAIVSHVEALRSRNQQQLADSLLFEAQRALGRVGLTLEIADDSHLHKPADRHGSFSTTAWVSRSSSTSGTASDAQRSSSLFPSRGPGGSSSVARVVASCITPELTPPTKKTSADLPSRHRSVSASNYFFTASENNAPSGSRSRSISPRATLVTTATPHEVSHPPEASSSHSRTFSTREHLLPRSASTHRPLSYQAKALSKTEEEIQKLRAERKQYEAENRSLTLQLYAGGSAAVARGSSSKRTSFK